MRNCRLCRRTDRGAQKKFQDVAALDSLPSSVGMSAKISENPVILDLVSVEGTHHQLDWTAVLSRYPNNCLRKDLDPVADRGTTAPFATKWSAEFINAVCALTDGVSDCLSLDITLANVQQLRALDWYWVGGNFPLRPVLAHMVTSTFPYFRPPDPDTDTTLDDKCAHMVWSALPAEKKATLAAPSCSVVIQLNAKYHGMAYMLIHQIFCTRSTTSLPVYDVQMVTGTVELEHDIKGRLCVMLLNPSYWKGEMATYDIKVALQIPSKV